MQQSALGLTCFVASIINAEIDPYLEERRFSHGLVIFAIPDYGILFRCRVGGEPLDLEFAAFFSLLKFIKVELAGERLTDLVVLSSKPEFVFSFVSQTNLLKGSEKERMLRVYLESFRVQVRFVEACRNKALLSPADYPSLPAHVPAVMKRPDAEPRVGRFKPFQRGIKL